MLTKNKPSITVSEKLLKQGGFVLLSFEEYKDLKKKATPTFYLHGKSARALDALVNHGLRQVVAGKTRKISSLADLD